MEENTSNEEILKGLKDIALMQQELMAVMMAIDQKLILPDPLPEQEEWVTMKMIMEDILFISKATFYRDLKVCNWQRKKIGGKWLYLKSSLFRE